MEYYQEKFTDAIQEGSREEKGSKNLAELFNEASSEPIKPN